MGKIGVAGCGRMGLPMAKALHAASFDVQGFDVRPTTEFGDFAPNMTTDPTDFSKNLTTLITVVRDQTQTDDVLFDAQAIIAKAPMLETLMVCSTLSPKYFQTVRERLPANIAMIDAPMSGAAIAAKERRLSFMIGGTPEDIKKAQPMFDAMGRHFHVMGGPGAGMSAKVLNNLLAASSTAVTRLALDWGDQHGLDEKALLALMHTSSGQTWFGSNFDTIEFANNGFSTDNNIGILKKDVEAAIDGAPEGADLELPRAIIAAIHKLKPR